MYSLYAEGKCVCKEYVYFYKFIMNIMKYEYSKVNPKGPSTLAVTKFYYEPTSFNEGYNTGLNSLQYLFFYPF